MHILVIVLSKFSNELSLSRIFELLLRLGRASQNIDVCCEAP